MGRKREFNRGVWGEIVREERRDRVEWWLEVKKEERVKKRRVVNIVRYRKISYDKDLIEFIEFIFYVLII